MNLDTYLEENQLRMDHRSTMKGKTVKFSVENLSEWHHDLGVGKSLSPPLPLFWSNHKCLLSIDYVKDISSSVFIFT